MRAPPLTSNIYFSTSESTNTFSRAPKPEQALRYETKCAPSALSVLQAGYSTPKTVRLPRCGRTALDGGRPLQWVTYVQDMASTACV